MYESARNTFIILFNWYCCNTFIYQLVVFVLSYLLTPWSRVLLEKLTGSAASQENPRIFGTRKFIAVLTSARHLSLSWANSIQPSQPPPTSWISILILSSHMPLFYLFYLCLHRASIISTLYLLFQLIHTIIKS